MKKALKIQTDAGFIFIPRQEMTPAQVNAMIYDISGILVDGCIPDFFKSEELCLEAIKRVGHLVYTISTVGKQASEKDEYCGVLVSHADGVHITEGSESAALALIDILCFLHQSGLT